MSFRQFGGLQFSSKHNAVASNYNTSNNLLVTQNVGQSNSYINFLSDISGNQIFGDLDVSGNLTASEIFLTAPTHNYAYNEVVPKAYVDTVGAGLKPQGKVKVISSFNCSSYNTTYPVPIATNITLPFNIDGVSINVGDNVLLNDQGSNNGQDAAVNNGVYTLNSYSGPIYQFNRSTTILPLDASSNSAFITVSQGTVNSLSGWVQTNDVEPNTVGTTEMIFSEYYSFAYKLGQGLSATTQSGQVYINVDSSLNFINYLDGSNNDTINIGTNTNTIKIGRLTGNNNKIYVNQNSVGINNNSPSSSYALDVSGILQVQDGTFQALFPTSLNGLNVSTSSFYYAPNPATWTYNPSTIIVPPFKIELEGANCLIYKATGGLGGSATIIQNTGTAGGIALASTTTAIYVNENGTTPGVGIGTSTPGYPLDISGNSGTILRLQNNIQVYNNSSANIEFWTATGDCPLGSISTQDLSYMPPSGQGGSYTSQMSFNVNWNSTSIGALINGMTLTGTYDEYPTSTYIGGANLTINGATYYSGLTSTPSSGNPMPAALTIATTTGSEKLLLGAYYTPGVASASAIQALDYTTGSVFQQLLLNPFGGNVGINNINPQYPLDVSGDTNISGTITNTATQPASTDSSTKVPTTAWVQSAITSGLTGSKLAYYRTALIAGNQAPLTTPLVIQVNTGSVTGASITMVPLVFRMTFSYTNGTTSANQFDSGGVSTFCNTATAIFNYFPFCSQPVVSGTNANYLNNAIVTSTSNTAYYCPSVYGNTYGRPFWCTAIQNENNVSSIFPFTFTGTPFLNGIKQIVFNPSAVGYPAASSFYWEWTIEVINPSAYAGMITSTGFSVNLNC